MADLPQELIAEIFSRLPTKSIGNCRRLSKTWNINLSTSQFIKLHLTNRKTHNQENIIILTQFGSLQLVTPSAISVINNSNKKFSVEITRDKWFRLLGSSNGLLLLQNLKKTVFVVNPIIRKQVTIPTPPSVLSKDDMVVQYGFGYDPCCDDYKVVTLVCQKGSTYELDVYRMNVCQQGSTYKLDVYCMKTRVWKTLDYPFGYSDDSSNVMPFVNGSLHWLTSIDRSSYQHDRICAFDLPTESFREIPLPKGLEVKFISNVLVVFQGCLANISILDDANADLWVMNEHGVQDSWARIHIHENVMSNSLVRPVSFVGDEEMICVIGNNRWVVYDLKEERWKKKV